MAYIDPGAGGLLIQLVIGGIAGMAVLIRLRWRSLKAWFRRDSAASTSDHEE